MASSASVTDNYLIVPGTVFIVSKDEVTSFGSQIILVPSPSNDLDDPLRWSRSRKLYHLTLLVVYTTVMAAVTNWESPVYLILSEALNTPIPTMNIGAALLLLMLGIGNVFLTPLSHKLGRRFVYLLSLLISIVSQIWLFKARNSHDYIGAHVLLGIATAPFEALPAISIADIFFAHERGTMMSFYVFGLSLGSFVGPICSGYIFESMGWQWIFRLGAIIQAFVFVLFFFTFEESNFVRPKGQEDVEIAEETAQSSTSTMKNAHGDAKPITEDEIERTTTYHKGEILSSGSFKLQTKIYHKFPGTFQQYCRQCFQPLLCCWFPAVLWTGINYGTCVSWLAILGTTTAFILAAPPYYFSNSALGLIWIAPLIGSLLGAYYSGPLNDRLALYLAGKNHGWREPEFRLWSFLSGALIMPAGLILYGAGAAAGLPWIGPIFGMGMIGFGLSIGGTVAISYIIDSYRDIDGEAVTTVILIRNIIGFGITFGIQQWITGMGLRNCFIMIGCLSFTITAFAGVFIAYGKQWRRLTQPWYERLSMKAM